MQKAISIISRTGIIFVSFKAKRQVKGIEKYNLKLSKSLYKLDFTEVREVENKMAQILKSVSQSEKICQNCPYTKCKTRYMGSYFTPLRVSFERLLKAIEDSYHLNADEIFENEEE